MHPLRSSPGQIGSSSTAAALASAGIVALLIVGYAFSSGPPRELWIAESRGVLALEPHAGTTTLEIPLIPAPRAVAVDGQTRTAWVFAGQELRAYSFAGELKSVTDIAPPAGNPALLQVDPQAGRVWLAVQARLYLFDGHGTAIAQHGIGHPITAMALDRRMSRLWVGAKESLAVFDAHGRQLLQIDTNGLTPRALDYDLSFGQMWLLAGDQLRRHGPDGGLVFTARNRWFGELEHVAADQRGGLWVASARELGHINGAGGIDARLAPFDGDNPSFVVDLEADATDHTAWVASQRNVRHYAAGGVLLAEHAPEDADGKALVIGQLALEVPRIAPEIRFTSPPAGSFLDTGAPTLRVAYAGDDIDLNSLQFATNGRALDVLCDVRPADADCVPTHALADGEHDLTATVANAAGNRSEPAAVHVTIDTIAPTIVLASPADDALTNQDTVRVQGRIDEPASLTFNGAAIPVSETGFVHIAPLVEGANVFQLAALDRAGNVGQRRLSVTRDTVAPPVPAASLVTARASGDAIVVSGAAGSVEGGARVTIVNVNTGDAVTAVAHADGSFTATLAGADGDALRIHATDGAGNQGAAAEVTVASGGPFSGPVRIGAVSPASGHTVDADFVLVTLDVQAPPNSGVTVNDIVAMAVPNGSGLRYVAEVPLKVGANTLNVRLRSHDGRTVDRQIEVTSTRAFPYRIFSHRPAGTAPFTSAIEVWDQLGYGLRRIDVDFDGDGDVEISRASDEPIPVSFDGVGVRQVRVTVVDDAMDAHHKLLTFVVLDPALVDRSVQAIWAGMNDALVAGDADAALAFLSDAARERYEPVFEALLPHMPQIVASYSAPRRSLVTSSYSEYGVNRTIDGVNRVFLVGFVVNEFGQWQLDSM